MELMLRSFDGMDLPILGSISLISTCRNVVYNVNRARPFAQKPIFSNLIGLRPGQPVGNWRDSNQGLGYGFYPFDVNTALVPASLRATQTLMQAGIIRGLNFTSTDISKMANTWEHHALSLFEVSVGHTKAEGYLQDFVRAANLSQSLLERDNSTDPTAATRFYALSLMQDGKHVEVMNSDMGFNLVYGTNVSRAFLQRTIDTLRPYPRGKNLMLSAHRWRLSLILL